MGSIEQAPVASQALPVAVDKHDVYPFISIDGNLKDAAKGKSVLVTGAGTGIGKAIALAFARAQADILILTSRRQSVLDAVKKEIEGTASTTKVLVIPADITDEKTVETLFSKIKAEGVTVNVLVNNAAGHYNRASIIGSSVEDWWKGWEVLLKGPFAMTSYFLRHLEQANSMSNNVLINVSSLAAILPVPGQSDYNVAKLALNRLTEWTALEGRRFGLRAISYHPGGIDGTEMVQKIPEWMKSFMTETAELAAHVAVYLQTSRAAYLNGRFLDGRMDLEQLEKYQDKIVKENLLTFGLLGYDPIPMPDMLLAMFDER